MKILNEVRVKIKSILVYFEMGATPDYSSVFIYNDGKGGQPQVTLSYGFTQDYNLREVLVTYCKNTDAILRNKIKPYIRNIKNPLLYKDTAFIELLREAGKDPIMQQVQDELFQKLYLQPAEDWATAEGFIYPLSLAVITDSFLQSGKIPMDIRINFAERTPANGGNEKVWVKQYLEERKRWLNSRKLDAVKKSIYRPNCFLEAVAKNNWSLLAPVNANGRTIK